MKTPTDVECGIAVRKALKVVVEKLVENSTNLAELKCGCWGVDADEAFDWACDNDDRALGLYAIGMERALRWEIKTWAEELNLENKWRGCGCDVNSERGAA